MKTVTLFAVLGVGMSLVHCGKSSPPPPIVLSSSIFTAVRSRNALQVEWHIQAGANLSETDALGRTPLGVAVRMAASHYDQNDPVLLIVKHLLLAKADPNAADSEGRTALHWVSYIGRPDIAKLLLDNGADAQLKDGDGKTARQLAEESLAANSLHRSKEYTDVISLLPSAPANDSSTSATQSRAE